MEYAIIGHLNTDDSTKITGVINKYRVLDKESLHPSTGESGKPQFIFEYKTKDAGKKDGIFHDFKGLVDQHTGHIHWHECRHDEGVGHCVIAESYGDVSD